MQNSSSYTLKAPQPAHRSGSRPSTYNHGRAAHQHHDPPASGSLYVENTNSSTEFSVNGHDRITGLQQHISNISSLDAGEVAPPPPDIAMSPRKPTKARHGPKHMAKQLFGRTTRPKPKNPTNQGSSALEPVVSSHVSSFAQVDGPPSRQNRKEQHDSFDYSSDLAATQVTVPPAQSSKRSDASRPSTMDTFPTENVGERVEAGSVMSFETTNLSSVDLMPALQARSSRVDLNDPLEPLGGDDPGNFDLVAPFDSYSREYSLDRRADELFSKEHLQLIFKHPALLQQFSAFLSATRPTSLPLFVYYLDALKSLRAIRYANAVAEALQPVPGLDFTAGLVRPVLPSALEERANEAFETLVQNDLPAYIVHTWTRTVSLTIHMRITGKLPSHLRETSEGLAETFCLTDPSRKDNPIIFASEEFHRTTQYGVNYTIGRNCRFLQGPKTSTATIARLSRAIKEGRPASEIILNYRRDGSPFLNMLVMAPLLDSKGVVRYFIGFQVDVSGLAKDATDLPALKRLLRQQDQDQDQEIREDKNDDDNEDEDEDEGNEFLLLAEMLKQEEVELVRQHGGRMHVNQPNINDDATLSQQPRLLLEECSPPLSQASETFGKVDNNGRMPGLFQNYLLVRPYPSLRILFASPSMRIPGILQSTFMTRIGGSPQVREGLEHAMAAGRGVTAKVRWISGDSSLREGRMRWIHCTPLLGQNRSVGVWMIILQDELQQGAAAASVGGNLRTAPPISAQAYSPKDSDTRHQRFNLKSPPVDSRRPFECMLSDDEFDQKMANAPEISMHIGNLQDKRTEVDSLVLD